MTKGACLWEALAEAFHVGVGWKTAALVFLADMKDLCFIIKNLLTMTTKKKGNRKSLKKGNVITNLLSMIGLRKRHPPQKSLRQKVLASPSRLEHPQSEVREGLLKNEAPADRLKNQSKIKLLKTFSIFAKVFSRKKMHPPDAILPKSRCNAL